MNKNKSKCAIHCESIELKIVKDLDESIIYVEYM
jgi:hypothetical protein